MSSSLQYEPTWADVLEEYATEPPTALRLIAQLGAARPGARVLPCSSVGAGDAQPATRRARASRRSPRGRPHRDGLPALEGAAAAVFAQLPRRTRQKAGRVQRALFWRSARIVDWSRASPVRASHVLPTRRPAYLQEPQCSSARSKGPKRAATRASTPCRIYRSGRVSSTCARTCSAAIDDLRALCAS